MLMAVHSIFSSFPCIHAAQHVAYVAHQVSHVTPTWHGALAECGMWHKVPEHGSRARRWLAGTSLAGCWGLATIHLGIKAGTATHMH